MYKRRARILFLGRDAERLAQACRLAERIAVRELQARFVLLDDLETQAGLMAWADLLVALDDTACRVLAQGDKRPPHRCWPLPEEAAACQDALRVALESMRGGLRMMQRQDG